MSDKKKDIYNSDLRRTHNFRICIWVFHLWCMEDKCLVNCGDFTGDCRSTHGIISDFRCSEDKEGLFEVIYDTFMLIEVIFYK